MPARINREGFRDEEHPFERTPGKRRILVLGDSFAFGQGVDFGERFSEILERETADLEVVNLGVAGWATDQEVLAFEAAGRRWRPDTVLLLAFPFNDLPDIGCERLHSWPKPWFRLEAGALELVPPDRDLLTAIRTSSYLAEFVIGWLEPASTRTRRAPAWEGADPLPLFRALVRRLAKGCTEVGAGLLVVLVHPKNSEKAPRTATALGVIAGLEADGITVLDTHDAFAERREDVGRLYLPDYHWSPEGHRLIASLLLPRLRH